MSNPNIVIFRIPVPEDATFDETVVNGILFAEHDIIEGITQNEGRLFAVPKGDTYGTLEFNHIVLAEKLDDSSSIAYGVYSISTEDDAPVAIHDMPYLDLVASVLDILSTHESDAEDPEDEEG